MVGEQPVLSPGQSFEYQSACPLRTTQVRRGGWCRRGGAWGEGFWVGPDGHGVCACRMGCAALLLALAGEACAASALAAATLLTTPSPLALPRLLRRAAWRDIMSL